MTVVYNLVTRSLVNVAEGLVVTRSGHEISLFTDAHHLVLRKSRSTSRPRPCERHGELHIVTEK